MVFSEQTWVGAADAADSCGGGGTRRPQLKVVK